jgi:hypothetical protein
MDKMKGYVLLMINAGVRSSVSERKKFSEFSLFSIENSSCAVMTRSNPER